MSRIFTPTTQGFNASSSAFFGSPSDSETLSADPTDLPDRQIGHTIINITGGTSANANTDGLGHSGTGIASLEYKSTPGGVWTEVPGSQSIAFATGEGGEGSNSNGGPFAITLPVVITNLTQIGIRGVTSANSNGDTASASSADTVNAWTVVAQLKTGGMIGV